MLALILVQRSVRRMVKRRVGRRLLVKRVKESVWMHKHLLLLLKQRITDPFHPEVSRRSAHLNPHSVHRLRIPPCLHIIPHLQTPPVHRIQRCARCARVVQPLRTLASLRRGKLLRPLLHPHLSRVHRLVVGFLRPARTASRHLPRPA